MSLLRAHEAWGPLPLFPQHTRLSLKQPANTGNPLAVDLGSGLFREGLLPVCSGSQPLSPLRPRLLEQGVTSDQKGQCG